MSSDSRRLILVFVVLVMIVATPFIIDTLREHLRPELVAARVVTAAPSDPVFRTGGRRLDAGEEAEIALAVLLRQAGRPDRWLAPVDRLAIDGQEVDHIRSDQWPDDHRTLRVFWFTVESSFIGGVLTGDNAAERLKYRTYLAPEMGQALRAAGLPDIHSDDSLGGTESSWPAHAGTVRLYARAELVEEISDLQPLAAVTTPGVERLLDPAFPTLFRSFDFGGRLDPATGELLGLPGFEPEGATAEARNLVTVSAVGMEFSELVEARLVVSSWTLASVAASGSADLDPERLADLGTLEQLDDRLVRNGRPLEWERDVVSGDLLVSDTHWVVLVADNGDGVLDVSDTVLHCWGRPPERTTVLGALGPESATVGHLRLGERD